MKKSIPCPMRSWKMISWQHSRHKPYACKGANIPVEANFKFRYTWVDLIYPHLNAQWRTCFDVVVADERLFRRSIERWSNNLHHFQYDLKRILIFFACSIVFLTITLGGKSLIASQRWQNFLILGALALTAIEISSHYWPRS